MKQGMPQAKSQPVPRHHEYVEYGQPGYLEQAERMLKEWIQMYAEAKKHVASQEKVLQEFDDQLRAERQPEATDLRSKLLTYIGLHRQTLERGLYQRAQDILYKLRQIVEQTAKNDPHRAMQVNTMIVNLEGEWKDADPSFKDESPEEFRRTEERAWMNAVDAHQEWVANHPGEIHQIYARIANMIGVVRRASDRGLDHAAMDRTSKAKRKWVV